VFESFVFYENNLRTSLNKPIFAFLEILRYCSKNLVFLYYPFLFLKVLTWVNDSFGLALLLIPIELLLYIFKPISLGVRLFVNLMAGHTLLKVIIGFS